ncbi:MAG: hypothetical protein HY062_02565 [Bacteroidetes bacterium]|nr:hypothetical protein [Bacteroidota bacterium]
MQTIFTITIIIHVLAGIGALISGAMAIILKQNTPKHKPIGRFYFWCMTVIFITGVFLSTAKGLLFLFFISIFTYYATIIAYRSLRLKNLHNGQKLLWIDWLVEILAGITFMGLIMYAMYHFTVNHSSAAVIPLFFGSIGLLGVYRNVSSFIKGPKETMYWLKKHIGNMCGSYIGAITAFVVNQSEHIPVNPVFLWLGPTIILVPVIMVELKKIKSQPLIKVISKA